MKILRILLFAFLIPLTSNGCNHVQDDTTKVYDSVNLSEVIIQRTKKTKEIGLSNLKIKSSCQGITGDKVAVYIPHTSNKKQYIQSIKVAIKEPDRFTEGYVNLYLCKAFSPDQEPGEKLTLNDVKFIPSDKNKINNNQIQIELLNEVEMPINGVFVVCEWVYDRSGQDIITHTLRSAKVGGTFDLKKSYTWTSVGDFKTSWQHEGQKNSLSNNIFGGKLFNALIGVATRE